MIKNSLSIDLRPATFAEFIGNSPVISAIQNHLSGSRTNRAWLFSGLRGLGKTTLAMLVARELGVTEIEEYDAGSKGKVADIRELVAAAGQYPLGGGSRAVILNEAQQITSDGQEALKIATESPDSATVWIFTSTHPEDIDDALRSRCQWFRLKPVSREDVAMLVARGLAALGSSADPGKFCVAAFEARLTPREILMALERYASGLPIEDAIIDPEARPEYIPVACAVMAGDSGKVLSLLRTLRHLDCKGMRGLVLSFMRKRLLEGDRRASECIQGLFKYQSFSDAELQAGTADWLYRSAEKFRS